MEQIISSNLKLSTTLFYKDQYNYATSFIYDADPTPYAMFVNGDYANSRGIEITMDKRFSNYWAVQINYTFSRAEGNANDEYTHWYESYAASVYGTFPSKKTITMPWDQPHTLNFIVNVRKPGSWGINIIGNLGSGLPYTPTDARGRRIDETNSARKPPTVNVDLRINKDFRFRKFTLRLFSDVYNALNYKNVIYVFSSTGKPNQSANPNASLEWQDRPHYYGAPRHIEIGLDILFRE
jgi:outer membrane receptor protein involved in Fe transport